MKPIITTLVVAALALLGAAPQAEARGHKSRVYISGYQSCGTPVYSERYFVGYDECGHEIWEVRRVRQQCRPVVRECDDDHDSYDRRSHREDRHQYRSKGRRHSVVIEGLFFR